MINMITEDIKYNGNLFLVLCRNSYKIKKYFKKNRIRKKILIDVDKMAKEEGMPYDEAIQYDFFRLLILKKLSEAIEKNRDIYYIPHYSENDTNKLNKIMDIKNIATKYIYSFNLLCLYDDFDLPADVQHILTRVDEFDVVQILQDY